MRNLLTNPRVASTGKATRTGKMAVNAIAALYLAFADYVAATLTATPWVTLEAVNALTALSNAGKSGNVKAIDAAIKALDAVAALPAGEDDSAYCSALSSAVRTHLASFGKVADGLVYLPAMGEHRPAIVTTRQLGNVPAFTALTIGVFNQRVTQYNRAHADRPYLVYVWRDTGECQIHKLPRRKSDGTFGGQLNASQSFTAAELQALFAKSQRGKAAKLPRKGKAPVAAPVAADAAPSADAAPVPADAS